MTSEERFERMERILDRVAENQLQIDTTLLTLTHSHAQRAESHTRLADAQARTELQVTAIGIAVEQAYLSTMRPQ